MKKFLAAALVASMALSLGACSTEPKQPSSSGSSSGGDAAKTTITWWAFPTFGAGEQAGVYEKEVIAAFEEANPDIKVELTTIDFTSGPEAITAAIEGGTAPDVLFDAPGRIIEYGNAGKLVELSDMFTEEFIADVNNEALINSCKGHDGTYMYPLSSAPFYMGLNKNMLEEANALQYVNLEGDRAWTTDNFVKMCEALKASGVCQVPGIVYCGGQGGDQGTRALVSNLYGGTIANDEMTEYTFNSAEAVKGLELLQDMVSKGLLDSGNSMVAADELQKYQQETCAMTFCWGTSNAQNYALSDGESISVPFPSDDGVPALEYLVNGFCVFDNGDQAKADAAKKFIQFVCDDETWGPRSVVRSGAFPVRTSFGDLYPDNDEMTLLASWTQYYAPYYNTMDGFASMRKEWYNMLQKVLAGEDAQAMADAAVAASNAAMQG